MPTAEPTADPLWYKDAIIYELHVRAFRDSIGEGIGDFTGLTAKLDYLDDLGVTAVWLLPFYPSPLQGRRLRHRRLHHYPSHLRTLDDFAISSTWRTSRGFVSSPSSSSTIRPITPVVPGARRGRPASPNAILCLERHAGEISRTLASSSRISSPPIGLGPGRQGLLLASLLHPSARSELRQPGRHRAILRSSISGSTWAWTGCGSTPSPIFSNAKAPAAKTCPKRTIF